MSNKLQSTFHDVCGFQKEKKNQFINSAITIFINVLLTTNVII